MNAIDFQPILTAWKPFHAASDIGHIKSEAHYKRMVALADHLVESGAASDDHELEDMFLLICDLIEQYEEQHYPPSDVSPGGMLRFLMTQHGLKNADLPELGDAETVARLLDDDEGLSVRQIRLLANRFAISPATFV